MICRRPSQASKSTWLLSASLIAAAIAMWSGIPTSAFAAQDCAALANLKINNTNLLSAVEVPADGDLPAYCRVLGYVRPAINFEIKLPLQGIRPRTAAASIGFHRRDGSHGMQDSVRFNGV